MNATVASQVAKGLKTWDYVKVVNFKEIHEELRRIYTGDWPKDDFWQLCYKAAKQL